MAELSRRWSPYSNAYNNPVRFIDPDGRLPFDSRDSRKKEEKREEGLHKFNIGEFKTFSDGYVVDRRGRTRRVDNTGSKFFDVLWAEEVYKPGVSINEGVVLPRSVLKSKKSHKTYTGDSEAYYSGFGEPVDTYKLKSDSKARQLMLYLDKYTDVEWGNTLFEKDGRFWNLLMTSGDDITIAGAWEMKYYYMRKGYCIIRDDHIHPTSGFKPSEWDGDWGHARNILDMSPQAKFNILSNGIFYPFVPPPRP